MTTFLFPDFTKAIPDKVNDLLQLKSPHAIAIPNANGYARPAIASSGFSASQDGTFVFATKIDELGNGMLNPGFTDMKTFPSSASGFPGNEAIAGKTVSMSGTSLSGFYGVRRPGNTPYLPVEIWKKVKEVVSILTITNNGRKKEVCWIVDNTEGRVVDCSKDFGSGSEIFPCITFGTENLPQQVHTICFGNVTSRSPRIDKLMVEYNASISKSSSSPTFLFPEFSKIIPGKLSAEFSLASPQLLIVENPKGKARPAIAMDGFSATRDGVFVFATQIDQGGDGSVNIGFTDAPTCRAEFGYPGYSRDMTGTSLSCFYGVRRPGETVFFTPDVSRRAKEVVAILTITNNGSNKEICWIVDGTESTATDCTKDFGSGSEIFPCVTFGSDSSTQVARIIRFGDLVSRSKKINLLLNEYNTNNSSDRTASTSSAQMKLELEKEKLRAETLAVELEQKKIIIAQKDKQLEAKDSEIDQLKKQILLLQQSSQLQQPQTPTTVSPFVKDKPYQIDLEVNGVPLPDDPNAFGTLLKLPSAASSPLFNEARSMFRNGGAWAYGSRNPVAGFELKEIEVIVPDVSTIESRIRRLQQLRAKDVGTFFNPSSNSFTAEQLQTLISLRDQFLPRPSNATDKTPNLINVFHGTKVAKLDSVVHGLVAVRSTDAGFFGLGVYTTTSIEYAAKYARGDFDANNGPYPPRDSDGCVPVVWCVAAVGVCYPVTPQEDYKKRNDGNSDFFGVGLKPGYDCHCAGVSQSNGFQAVPRKEMQYMEIVFDQEVQVLPIAVLWVKEM